MEKNAINVKDYFQGMENLYEPNLVTVFLLTHKYYVKARQAQLSWMGLQLKKWIKIISEETEIRIISVNLSGEGKEVLFKAELLLSGTLRNDLNLNCFVQEGIMNSIKKDLVRQIFNNFPLCSEDDILFSPNIPILFSLRRYNVYWEEGELNLLKTGEFRRELDEIFSHYKARIIDVYSGEGKPEEFLLKFLTIKFEFNEEVEYEKLSELELKLSLFLNQKIICTVSLLGD